MALKDFFKTAWVFFLAAGVIVACSAALYFLMGIALEPDDTHTTYIEPQRERILAIADDETQEDDDTAIGIPGAEASTVLPQYTLVLLHTVETSGGEKVAGGEFTEGDEAYDAAYTPEGAIPVSQAGDIAVRYVMLLAGENLEGAECRIHATEYWDPAIDGPRQYWRTEIVPADEAFRIPVWLDAYTGQLHELEKTEENPDVAWTAEGISRDILTQYEFARVTKECLLLAKELLEDHLLEGRQVYDVQSGWTNTYENRQVINSGNLITYNFWLDDGMGYHVAFSVKSEETPELCVLSMTSDVERAWAVETAYAQGDVDA